MVLLGKLIIADASPSVQKALQLALTDSRLEIHAFENGLELIKALPEIQPDAILLSLSLPGKDGYEVGAYLRSQEKFRNISLILLRAAFEPLDEERMALLENVEIVQKPFDSEKLAERIIEIVGEKKEPSTLPEELTPEEFLEGMEFSERPFSPKISSAGEGKIREILREEILEIERELEKRLRLKLRAEFQSWIKKGQNDEENES